MMRGVVAAVAVRELLSHGFVLTVHDGVEAIICQSADATAVLRTLSAVGQSTWILVHDPRCLWANGRPKWCGWLRFIQHGRLENVLEDYSLGLAPNLIKTLALIDRLERWGWRLVAGGRKDGQ